ncbi:probable enoyl-CoA hydratase isoform X2 [Dermacentor andersoni]|uniref:probable enoyl-CoA hydratase isoform X2 n=1 Tax=Dermacentor andersoni TaxID=34620 RepID=UPI003B3B275B
MQALRRPFQSAVMCYLRTVPWQARASSDASCPVVCDKQGRILLVGLNRPEKRNCINVAAAQQLLEAFHEFDRDDSVDVAVLHGKGGSFCAGYDLSELAEDSLDDWPECVPETRKPTVAAVSGYAVGAGMELALWCDLRVVDETAVMGLFGRRFGVPLMAGGSARLPALIGLSRALDLVLTGRPISAKEAHEIGLANRVVSCGTALGQAISLAGSIVKFPQGCVQADRAAVYNASFHSRDLSEALAFERKTARGVLHSEAVHGEADHIDHSFCSFPAPVVPSMLLKGLQQQNFEPHTYVTSVDICAKLYV